MLSSSRSSSGFCFEQGCDFRLNYSVVVPRVPVVGTWSGGEVDGFKRGPVISFPEVSGWLCSVGVPFA